jgi:peptide/nickel transport system ATP-binding protein
VNPPKGCRFAPRCPYARERCHEEEPVLTAADDGPDHTFACFYPVGSPEYLEREVEVQAKIAAERDTLASTGAGVGEGEG